MNPKTKSKNTAKDDGSAKIRRQQAAVRALAEAQERRDAAEKKKQMPSETGGPRGIEPTRYGDWERKGITSDF
ncbi:MAG: DUF1674 domain-containing protein [Robiginitomaculum sp.]|nr:MAG: DUF1674 domain-containing protein [Robiginitomaculum sp.]